MTMDLWRAWSERDEALRASVVSSSNMAQALAHHADDSLKEVDTVLFELVERIESDGTRPGALQRVHGLLTQIPTELPQIQSVDVYDEDGRILVSSMSDQNPDINNSDREYFQYHRANVDHQVHIGLPVKSRRTGKWVIPLSRRFEHADGSFAGVVSAAFDIDYFSRFYKRFDIGRQGAIVLAFNSGIMVLRYPTLPGSTGKDVTAAATFRDYAAKQFAGSVTLVSELDGVTRLNSFQHLERYPLFVNVALGRDDVLDGWWSAAIVHVCGAISLVLALALVGWRLIAQIKLRAGAEQQLVQAHGAMEALNQSLEQLAMQDSLTGLANRRRFDLALASEHRRAVSHESALALIMIDIDYFKQYNDIYGHLAGDECLRVIAKVIKESGQRRAGDLAARYGGEEISVLLPDVDTESALQIAEKIRRGIRALKITHGGSPYGIVTISVGIDAVDAPPRTNQPELLIRVADRALYAAKSAGRDRSRIAGEVMPEQGA